MGRSLLFLCVFAGLPARSADVWSSPYPGVQLLKRTTSQPVVFWAVVVDSCAPGIRFRVSGPGEGNRVTSSFGRLVGAQLAINGDFADHDFGLNVGNGQAWPYPDTTHSGNFSVGSNRLEMTPDHVQLAGPAPWVTEQLGGRWTLLAEGVPQYGIDDNGPSAGGFVCAPGLRHPRTAIGLSQDKRKVILLVADGRSSASIGMTCDEMIDVFRELGAHDAMGLDGGGSSTLWKNDQLINHPTDSGGERVVRNHLAIFASGAGPAPHCGAQLAPPEPAQASAVPGAILPAVLPLAAPTRFTPLPPARLFDTRTAANSTRLVRSDGTSEGPLSLTSSGAFSDWATSGVPAGASAVWLNVVTVGRQVPGYLTVFPEGRPVPATSNVNFGAGQVVANAVPVALGSGGRVNFNAHTAVEVIADLSGAFAPTGSGLEPISPTRVLDTRTPSLPLRAGVTRAVDVRAPAGATAVAANLAVIAGAAGGYLTVWPCGAPMPSTSSVNFVAGAVVSNAVMSGLGADGMCLSATAEVNVVVDVTGYLTSSAVLSFVPLFPQRLLDTRQTTTPFSGRVAAGQVLQLPIESLPGMPAHVGAVVANLTVTSAAADGYLTAFPCGGAAPPTSTVNFQADQVVGGLSMTAVGQGALCVVSSVRAHLVVDLLGVWAVPPPVAPVDAGGAPGEVDAGASSVDAGVTRPAVDAPSGLQPAPEPAVPSCATVGSAGGGTWLLVGAAALSRRRRRAERAGL